MNLIVLSMVHKRGRAYRNSRGNRTESPFCL